MDLKKLEQNLVDAYHQATVEKCANFAIMSENDAYYIVLRFTGYIQALEHRAFLGSERAQKEHATAIRLLEAPIRQFLTAVESQLTFKINLNI